MGRSKPLRAIPMMLAAGSACTAISHGALVSFAQAEYIVAPGESFPLEVLIDFEPGDVAANLFSFGVRVIPEPGAPLLVDEIAAVSELSFFGAGGAPALINPAPGILGAKGNVIDFQAPYAGPLLATYQAHFSTPGTYVVGLEMFNTLGPTEQIFVGGNGTVLDSQIRFASATITVIPEPGVSGLLAAVALGAVLRRTRPGRRDPVA